MSVNTEVGEDASQVNLHAAQPLKEEGISVSKERLKREGSSSEVLQGDMPPSYSIIAQRTASHEMIKPYVAVVHRGQPSNEEGNNVSKERIKGGGVELQGMPPPSALIGYGASSERTTLQLRYHSMLDEVLCRGSPCLSTLIGYGAFDPSERRTSHEILKPHVQSKATLTSESLPPQDVVLVRRRTNDGPTSHKDKLDHGSSLVLQNGDEKIPEEEGVCRFCFIKLREENKLLKLNCRCSNTLTHEECLANWSREKGNSNCDFCGQEVRSFPVTLFRGSNSSQRIDSQGTKKHWLFSWLIRILKGRF